VEVVLERKVSIKQEMIRVAVMVVLGYKYHYFHTL
jgi:hypothetical protein